MKARYGHRRDTSRLAAVLVLACAGAGAWAQQAVVRSYDAPELEVGQAWLTRSGGRCLAVMPWHVAAETSVPSLLAEGARGLRGEASEVTDLGDDAAVALLTGNIAEACGATLGSISRNVDGQVRGGGIGALRTVNGDGTLGRLAVTIVDDDGATYLRVLPTSPEERIRKGLSGSLLLLNDRPVGMLLSVHARSGVGTVMRTDALLARVEAHLRDGGAVAGSGGAAVPPPVGPDAGAAVAAPAPPAAAGAWRVVAWTVDPLGSAHVAGVLVAPGAEGFWAAGVPAWPAAVELGGPETVRIVSGVRFLAGAADPSALPRRVQVLTAVNPQRPAWRVAASAALEFEAGVATVTFLPVRARHVRLEMFGSAAGDRIALSRLEVLDAAR